MRVKGPFCTPPLAGLRRVLAEGPRDGGEHGNAVVDFVLVSLLIVTLLLPVLQVAVYVHVRNVVTASAQEGARYAANADGEAVRGAAARSRSPGRVERALAERCVVHRWAAGHPADRSVLLQSRRPGEEN